MSYQVIARKYRPQRFSDVVGQDHVTQTLSNAIQQRRIAHAYLFVGPRGTGKTTIARIFAKCLNCMGGPKVDFPEDDPRAVEISEGRSLDVLEIDGASNRGIEEIRALRETVKYAPATSRYKIYIIDEVHMLTKEAFNALLKTLEEPPEHAKFMFATTEPEKVLPTILSRCQRFDLRRIPVMLIVKHLAHIANLEKVKIDEAALYAIARGSEGCLRDAESTLDQLISFCGAQIVETDVLTMFGLASRDQIHLLASAVLAGDMEKALGALDELAKTGKDIGRLVSDLLNHFRNLLLLQIAKGALDSLELPEAELAVLKEQTKLGTADALTRIMEVFSEAESRLRETASKRILIEITLIKAIQARHAISLDSVLRQLQQLRVSGSSETAPAELHENQTRPLAEAPAPPAVRRSTVPALLAASEPAPKPRPAIAVESPPATPVAPPAIDADREDLESLWQKIVDAVGRSSPFTRSYLLQATPVSLTKNLLTIGFSLEFADHIDLVDNVKNRTLIQTKLKEVGLGEIQVKFIKTNAIAGPKATGTAVESGVSSLKTAAEAQTDSAQVKPARAPEAKPAKPPPPAAEKDDFKNDPLIKQALEIFKGQIVQIRA